ncbi:TadE family protein [Microbacterium rhizomatis]|uniref:TadE family protein n=1 Tax=Microbacterium rhizomatis TaxID=1631477 RepID=A0A5J5J5V0_9MICO|nr:TadE family protein [Microbacterium rhizomatis]
MRETQSARRALGETGSAALEFIVAGLLLLVPVVYLVVSLGLIQEQSLGVEAGARHIARSVSSAPDAVTAATRARAALATVVGEYGLDRDSVRIEMSCRPAGAACPEAGVTLIVTLSAKVSLPLIPPVLGLDRLATVPVEASAMQRVSQFWGAP